jgi:hypothetical protein
LKAATLIQKMMRGSYYRTQGRIFMCETMLETALQRKDELLINRAIAMPQLFGVTSKLIKVYQASAKKLIMEVLSEAFVANELREAMQVGSVEMLRSAIRRANEAKMPYLVELQEARRTLTQLLHLRTVLTNIEKYVRSIWQYIFIFIVCCILGCFVVLRNNVLLNFVVVPFCLLLLIFSLSLHATVFWLNV